MDTTARRPSGMFAFSIVWLGQLVSLFGSAMTGFALTLWAWQVSGSATALALVGLFSFGPTVLLSPIAGALVDRWNRKLVMMLSDLAAGLSSVIVLLTPPEISKSGTCMSQGLWRGRSRRSSFRPIRRRSRRCCPRSSMAVPTG